MKGDPICIFYFVQKNYYTALVSCFYILLFSVYIVIVNTAKSGTGLDNLSVDIYIYIYLYFKVQVVIREKLRAFYFRSTSLSLTRFLFITKALRFKRWVQGSPVTFALGSKAVGLF